MTTTPPGARATAWSVVVPVKPLAVAKSRLRGVPSHGRARLVLAMALDTVAVAVSCSDVGGVWVVTADPEVTRDARVLGAAVVPDVEAGGLNAAVAAGAARAAAERPGAGVAVLLGDLPALSGDELAGALRAATAHRRAFVRDADGSGTTLLAAAPGVPLEPAYGAGSAARHAGGGAVELDLPAGSGLRRDVDTVADLQVALRAGVGPATAAALAGEDLLGDGPALARS